MGAGGVCGRSRRGFERSLATPLGKLRGVRLNRSMHATVFCRECSDTPTGGDCTFAIGEDATINAKCPAGHEVRGVVQNPKRELLFDLGMRALVDGYYREAIMNMASALESTYATFALAAARFAAGVPDNTDEPGLLKARERSETLHAWWAKQSERQLGACIAAYTMLTGTVPDWQKEAEKNAKVRNDVVHSGVVPTEAQARAYAEFSYERIVHLVDVLKAKAGNALEQEDTSVLVRRWRKLGFTNQNTTFMLGTTINACIQRLEPRPFAQAFEEYVLFQARREKATELHRLLKFFGSGEREAGAD